MRRMPIYCCTTRLVGLLLACGLPSECGITREPRYNSRVVPSVTELKFECCAGGSLTKRRCECIPRVIRLCLAPERGSFGRSVHQAAVQEMPNPINKTRRPTALTIKTFDELVNQLIR